MVQSPPNYKSLPHLTNFLVKGGNGLDGLRLLLCSGEPGNGSSRPLKFGAELLPFALPFF